MSTIDTLRIASVFVACAIIIWRCEPAMNRMGRRAKTPYIMFGAFFLLAVAAAWQIVEILFGGLPSWPAGLVFSGAAGLLICERRLRVLCPPQRRMAP